MAKENISRGTVGLVHPITGAYIIIDDDGNIRIGGEAFGDCIFYKGISGELLIKSNKIRFISDDVEWNDLVFNKSATNPSQATFISKQDSSLRKELTRYGN